MAEPLQTSCPSCRQWLQIPPEGLGGPIMCPFCKAQFNVVGVPVSVPVPVPVVAPGGLPQVTPAMAAHLSATRPWVLFLSILGFIGCGLLALSGLFGMANGAMAAHGSGIRMLAGLSNIVTGVLYVFPVLFLTRYAGGIRRFLDTRAGAAMETALEAQKSFWRFTGILAIVGLCVGVLLLFILLAIGVSAMSGL